MLKNLYGKLAFLSLLGAATSASMAADFSPAAGTTINSSPVTVSWDSSTSQQWVRAFDGETKIYDSGRQSSASGSVSFAVSEDLDSLIVIFYEYLPEGWTANERTYEVAIGDGGGDGGGGGGGGGGCEALPSHAELTTALKASVAATGGPPNGGFDLNMWATVVNRDGVVCAVTYTGNNRADQWPGSRVISAQKANTANSFSLPGLSLSTANIYAATQPGGSLYGLQHSNPVDTAVAYGGPSHEGGSAADYGTMADPMVGHFIGGVNVFGGGIALYNAESELVGAIGVSGDTSCADHNVAWRTRHQLELDYTPAGVGPSPLIDSINYQGAAGNTALQEDFSHPVCAIAGVDLVSAISASLPEPR
ncbi:MAG: heme-binding protein [Granulosicoccus sp.]